MPHRSLKSLLAACLAGPLVLIGGSAASETNRSGDWQCPDGRTTVANSSRHLAARICAQAELARQFLGRCGIEGRAPLRISMSQVLGRSRKQKAGEYDPSTGTIRLLAYAAFVKAGWRAIGETHVVTRVLHASVATHEVAHGVFHEHAAAADLPETAHEYVAYVAQLSTLPADVRDDLARQNELPRIANLFTFSHFLLYADPERFAIAAWRHFHQPENGCAFLHAVVEGKVHFPPIGD